MFDFKKFGAFPIILVFLAVMGTVFIYTILPSVVNSATILHIGDGVFRTQVVQNSDDVNKELSAVSKLDPDQALLVVFPSDKRWEIQTKDMQMSVDIIWLSGDKKIVYIAKDVEPKDKATVPKTMAKYVIELPSGTTKAKSIGVNSMAIFQIEELTSN